MSYLFDAGSSNEISVAQSTTSVSESGRHEYRSPHIGEMILYYYPLSFYSQIVLLSMYQKKIPFTAQIVDIHKGDQFQEDFLVLNPRGEVPVLSCGVTNTKMTDSIQMINHLDAIFAHEPNIPKLHPDDPTQAYRCAEFVRKLHLLKLEVLTFGSVQFSDLHIDPQGAYKLECNREDMREYLKRRRKIYRTEAKRFPEFAESLAGKLRDIEHDWHFLTIREDYERLLVTFEKELDECEAELAAHPVKPIKYHPNGEIEDEVGWWLVSEQFSVADICLGIILHRIWEIGFYKRLIKPRPHVQEYYERVKCLDSFKKATGETAKLVFNGRNYLWWLVLIPLGTIIVFGLWGLIEGPPKMSKTEITTIPVYRRGV